MPKKPFQGGQKFQPIFSLGMSRNAWERTDPPFLTPNPALSESVPRTEQSSADEWMRGCQCPMSAVTDETCPPLPPTPHFAADRPIGPNPGLTAHFTQCQSIKYKYSSDGPVGPNLGLEAQCNTAHTCRRYTIQ